MLKCPKCGNEYEFYTKERYKGTCNVYFKSDGSPSDNTEMYEHTEHSYISKFVFCNSCDARVCKVDEAAHIFGW